MRTTISIDDDLYRIASKYAPGMNKAELIKEAIKTFIHIEASRRLAALGGTMPDIEETPRRKPEDFTNE